MNKKLNVFQQVRDLEGWHAVAFSATLLERMLPNYVLFCEATEFADPAQYRNSLNAIWEWLAVPKAKINFAVQLEKIEELVPDASDFDNYGVYPAIDVAMSMSATILLIQGEDPQGAVFNAKTTVKTKGKTARTNNIWANSTWGAVLRANTTRGPTLRRLALLGANTT